MSNYDDDSDGKRPLIPLRIPASLLSTLSSESRIKLYHNNDSGDVESLTVTQSKRTEDKQQTYPLEVTNSKQSTDWYQATTTTADNSLAASSKKELQHIGTSTKQYTINNNNKPSKSNTNIKQQQQNVKEIGKRTRKLLEEERAKRKEIVRLGYDTNNKDLCLPPLPEEKAAAAAEKQQQSTEKIKASQNKSSKPTTTTTRKRKRKVASNIDGYIPNVDHLLLSSDTTTISKDDYSNIIRLHGLPKGTKPEHIYKFFHGLYPSLIFVLPKFDCYIHGWDAASNNDNSEVNNNNDGNSSSILVERHASAFRLYVKFTSSLVANAAIERMGEPIGLDNRGEDSSIVCGKREIVGASIAMSPVPKHVALFLQKYMAIHTRKGESIIDTLTKIEQQLDTTVTQMSWIMAVEKLKLKQQIRRKGRSSSKTSSSISNDLDHLSQSYSIPEDKVQYQKLTKLYNQLVETHEKLELDCGILFYTFDPSLLDDSAHRIVASVSNWLLNKIKNVERVLRESRQRLEL